LKPAGADATDGGQDHRSEVPTRHVTDCQAERCRSRAAHSRSQSDRRRDDSVLPCRACCRVGDADAEPQIDIDIGVADAGTLIVIARSDAFAYDAGSFAHVADANPDVDIAFSPTDVTGPYAVADIAEADAITHIVETVVSPDSDSNPEPQAKHQAAITEPGSESAA
jgi:hypothetical protein